MILPPARLEVALRIDVDCCVGAREGVPALLRTLERVGAQATFLIALGSHTCAPIDLDSEGLCLRRTAGMQAPTLVEQPWIDAVCMAHLQEVGTHHHELGLLGWDAAGWRRRLARWYPSRVADEYAHGVRELTKFLGRAPEGTGAPGWMANDTTLSIADTFAFPWASDVRGVEPFYPRVGDRRLRTVQVPVTLPAGDEEEAADEDVWAARVLEQVGDSGSHVLAVRASALRPLLRLEQLLLALDSRGARFTTLGGVAAHAVAAGAPTCEVSQGAIPDRAGPVALQGPRAISGRRGRR